MSTKATESEGQDWREWPRATQPAGLIAPDPGSAPRRSLPEGAAEGDPGAGRLATVPVSPAGLSRRDYDTAFTLLQRASATFPALLRHCQQLEAELRRVRMEAAADTQAARGEMQQWQQIAVAMKLHLQEGDHQIEVLRQQLAAAEERLAAGQSLVQAAEHQARLAIGLTTLFHDKIVDAFGVGSPAHNALDAAARGGLATPPEDKAR